jgi:hypothetical protein
MSQWSDKRNDRVESVMSFYEIESGLSTLITPAERKREEAASMMRLRAKLKELNACGLALTLPPDDGEDIDTILDTIVDDSRDVHSVRV